MSNCTDPLLNDECTVLLIHSNNDHGTFVFTDSGNGPNCPHTLTRIGNAVHSECQAKFCKSSLFFPFTTGAIEAADHVDWTFPADFCYDFWIITLQSVLGCVFGMGNAGLAGIGEISINRIANKLVYYYAGSSILVSTSDINDGCSHHVAILRIGSNLYLYIDGVLEDSLPSFTPTIDGTHMRIGISHANTIPLFAFVDEVRISKGVGRWPSPFTPPIAPYSYTCYPPLAILSGTVKEKGANVIRKVRSYVRSTGALYSEAFSLANGTFEVYAPDDTTEMFVIAFDDDPGSQYNALIYDRVQGILI